MILEFYVFVNVRIFLENTHIMWRKIQKLLWFNKKKPKKYTIILYLRMMFVSLEQKKTNASYLEKGIYTHTHTQKFKEDFPF